MTRAVITGAKLGGARRELLESLQLRDPSTLLSGDGGMDAIGSIGVHHAGKTLDSFQQSKGGDDFIDVSISNVENIQVIESLCMKCYENGVTKLLCTRIPHFREVILAAFECEKCGYKSMCVE